ncbi:MAG: PEP-CTERM sorting domain-containing protein [Nitrospirota bacterium]
MQGNAVAMGGTDLNYGMSVEVAVAPEPVSSALFVVGAAALGFNGYRRRKRVYC